VRVSEVELIRESPLGFRNPKFRRRDFSAAKACSARSILACSKRSRRDTPGETELPPEGDPKKLRTMIV
jgi:hypothetical protein